MIKPLQKIIDLRSDTVSRMSPKMIEALCLDRVGQIHLKANPILNQLEEKVAKMFGKEKALFTISGTMSNLLAVFSHCKPGETAIIGRYSHINMYEQGGISSIAGVKPTQVDENPDGTLDFSVVSSKILPLNPAFSPTTLIASENSYNYLIGKVLPLDYPKRLSDFCKPKNIKTHLDGARLLNSFYHHKEKHPNLEIKDLTKDFDSISMCFSKCLRTPIGSILAGSEEFIYNAM